MKKIGSKWNLSDIGTEKDIQDEYELILKKESKLSYIQRLWVIRFQCYKISQTNKLKTQ